jgi:hypothetical protein
MQDSFGLNAAFFALGRAFVFALLACKSEPHDAANDASAASIMPSVLSSAPPGPLSAPAPCPSSLRVAAGDRFERITQRCYGSRIYQTWLIVHTGHKKRRLRADEELAIPSFETLVREQLPENLKDLAHWYAEAYQHYRAVEPEMDQQTRNAEPGVIQYMPSASARAHLGAADRAIASLCNALRARGMSCKPNRVGFGDSITLSTDYGTEQLHQNFYYSVEAFAHAQAAR